MTTEAIPTTVAAIASAYRQAIDSHRTHTVAHHVARLLAEQTKRSMDLRAAEILLTVQGRNADERGALHTIACEGDATYLSLRDTYDEARREMATHEQERDYQLHLCRLYQAMLGTEGRHD